MAKSAYQLKHISEDRIRRIPPQYKIEIVQNPIQARACGGTKSFAGRRSIDPPPIIKVSLLTNTNTNVVDHTYNFLFMTVATEIVDQNEENLGLVASKKNFKKRKPNLEKNKDNLIFGTTTVAANIATTPYDPDLEYEDLRAFFVFSDLSVRYEGYYRLVFHLWEYPLSPSENSLFVPQLIHRGKALSGIFKVYNAKSFPGLSALPQLTLTLKNMGLRVRVRKSSAKKDTSFSKALSMDNNLKVLLEILLALRQLPNEKSNPPMDPDIQNSQYYASAASYPYNNQNNQFYYFPDLKNGTPQPMNVNLVATASAAVQHRQESEMAMKEMNLSVTLDENIDDEFKKGNV